MSSQNKAELKEWLHKLAKTDPKDAAALEQAFRESEASVEKASGKEAADTVRAGELAIVKVIVGANAAVAKADKALMKDFDAFEALFEGLVFWGEPALLDGGSVPDHPTQKSEHAEIDKLLIKVSWVARTVIRDNQLEPEALKEWPGVETQIKKLLAEAAKHARAWGIQGSLVAAKEALANISKRVKAKNQRDADIEGADADVKAAEEQADLPDMAEKMELRQLEQLRLQLEDWKTALDQMGRIAPGDSRTKKAIEFLQLFYDIMDAKDKVAAFRKSPLSKQVKTIGELTLFTTGVIKDTVQAHADKALELARAAAKKSGNYSLVNQLEEKFKGLKAVSSIIAAYQVYQGIVGLIDAIQKGDPHAINAAAAKLGAAGVSVLEAAGVLTGVEAAGATGIVFLVWVEVDSIMKVAELLKWSQKWTALQAVKRMLGKAQKIVKPGKELAAAWNLMQEAQSSQDPKLARKYDQYEAIATARMKDVIKGLKSLKDELSNDKNSVGGYPELVEALGKPAYNAILDTGYGLAIEAVPAIADSFRVIVDGMKSMVTKGDELFGDAGPGIRDR